MEPAVALVTRRIVAEHVVAAVLADDPIVGPRIVVALDGGEASRLLGQRLQAVHRQAPLVLQALVVEAKGRVFGRRPNLHDLVAHVVEAARVDREEADVGARRRRDGIARVHQHRARVPRIEDVVDRIVDPFAEEQDGLAPAVDGRHELGQVLQRPQRVAGLVAALEVQRVGDLLLCARRAVRGARRRVEPALPVVLIETLDRPRAELLSDELVDGDVEQPRIAGELLRRVRPAARMDDGGEIVLTEVLVDELLGGSLDEGAAQRRRVVVVEHEHVQAPLEAARVRFDVGRHRRVAHHQPGRPLDRDVHLRKDVHLLQLAVLVDLEILAREALDDVALVVGDDGVHLDIVDFDPERDGRLPLRRRGRLRRTGRRRRLAGRRLGARRGREKGGSEQGGEESSSHGRATDRTHWYPTAALPASGGARALAHPGAEPNDYTAGHGRRRRVAPALARRIAILTPYDPRRGGRPVGPARRRPRRLAALRFSRLEPHCGEAGRPGELGDHRVTPVVLPHPPRRNAPEARARHRAAQSRCPARRDRNLRRARRARLGLDDARGRPAPRRDGVLARVRHPLPVPRRRGHDRHAAEAGGRGRLVGRPGAALRGGLGRGGAGDASRRLDPAVSRQGPDARLPARRARGRPDAGRVRSPDRDGPPVRR